MAGSNLTRVALAFALASACALDPGAAAEATVETEGRLGEFSIALPEGSDADVALAFGDGKVSVELPRGASFPLDFERESNGLLRSGEVTSIDAARVRLDLRLAAGVIERVEMGHGSVVIKMRRRFAESADGVAGRDADYRLGPEDRIQIAVNGDPKLTQTLVVRADGRASFPLVGDVAIGGQSVREASETLTELLARDYLVDPKVDLQVVEYKSRWVMVTGEIGKPGRVPLRGGATLKDALADADGLTVGAGDEIVISRDDPSGTGKIQIPVDRRAFERAEVDPALKSGDIISVPARSHVYVQGEVRAPGKVALERGMTLMKAISMAGSLTEWANEKSVQIISEGATGEPRLFNLKDIRSLRVPDPPLKGGDVIYVKRRFL
ncbi:MAG TPA: polysaccharide biosynthesis/export family protein [Candidatus Polarisedimenticolaceae bacterium]|nr:polysaccharide biosynthesis/export family protein [Candidatus Polarisedimenticolaceae bacterium]